MANERMDKLEETVNDIQTQLSRLDLDRMNQELRGVIIQLQKLQGKGKEDLMSNSKEQDHEEGYNGHEGIYGESSHSPHVWHTHPPPSQRPPKLDMHKFDGSHAAAWLAQIDQYFKLNHILDDATKLMLGSMYFDNERWEWNQRSNGYFRTWTQLTKALRDRFEQEDSYLGHLTKLRQTDEFYTECLISGLKEAIKAQALLHHPPTWTEARQVAHKVERALAAQYSRPNFPTKGRPPQAQNTTQTLKVQKVSPAEMAERRKQGLCYYCDEKYSPGHKCKEPKFFQIDATDYNSTEEDPPLEEHEPLEDDNQQENVSDGPVISLHALAGISSPQTLKIRGFIKHRPVVVTIDSGSTHNFIHQKVAETVHCFVRAVSNFQVQIADGGTMKCEGRCENVKL
eukprot:PITA_04919